MQTISLEQFPRRPGKSAPRTRKRKTFIHHPTTPHAYRNRINYDFSI